jgi:hypothetical protein
MWHCHWWRCLWDINQTYIFTAIVLSSFLRWGCRFLLALFILRSLRCMLVQHFFLFMLSYHPLGWWFSMFSCNSCFLIDRDVWVSDLECQGFNRKTLCSNPCWTRQHLVAPLTAAQHRFLIALKIAFKTNFVKYTMYV